MITWLWNTVRIVRIISKNRETLFTLKQIRAELLSFWWEFWSEFWIQFIHLLLMISIRSDFPIRESSQDTWRIDNKDFSLIDASLNITSGVRLFVAISGTKDFSFSIKKVGDGLDHGRFHGCRIRQFCNDSSHECSWRQEDRTLGQGVPILIL